MIVRDEADNLAERLPAKVNELRARLHNWRKEVGAQMPSRNPSYDPSKPEHDPATKKKKVKDEEVSDAAAHPPAAGTRGRHGAEAAS